MNQDLTIRDGLIQDAEAMGWDALREVMTAACIDDLPAATLDAALDNLAAALDTYVPDQGDSFQDKDVEYLEDLQYQVEDALGLM